MDFLKKLSINEDNATPAPAPVPVESKKEHILDKVSDVLGGGLHHQQSTPAPPPAQPKEEHLLDKLSSAFGGSHSTPAPAPAPQKEEHLLDKLSNAFGHSTPPPPPAPKHEGLLGKLEEVVGHATKSDEPAKPKTLGDKINNVLGGGSKGEQNEDTLDKAIDFVQEHVLKEGQQKDETAVEQLKDKQIAEVLRHGFKSATGKDIPSLHGHKNNE
ncbi:hypothetical protein H0H87_008739 [Tephrocybe sp. NHM501043]|nr:hypothetical protein H0H87_008739 [Tephrocybe sp. NHM501043]